MPQRRSPTPTDVLMDVLDSMEEALVAYDASGRLLVCNAAFRRMYGYTPEQTSPGVHFQELGRIDLQHGTVAVADEQGADYLRRKAEYRRELTGSFTVKLRDGRWIRTTDRPMHGGGFVSVQVDVSEIKAAEERTREAEARSREHEQRLARMNEELEVLVTSRTRALEAAMQLAEERARTDGLTGLGNRGAFFESAAVLESQARRHQRPYTLLMLDVDRFKAINDSFGHAAGDRALQDIGRILAASLRSEDLCGRIGGEEFAVLLPETTLEQGLLLAARLRERVSALRAARTADEPELSVSIGVAQCLLPEASLEDTLASADAALYAAKDSGRDRVMASPLPAGDE